MPRLLSTILLLFSLTAGANDLFLDVNLMSWHVRDGFIDEKTGNFTPYNENNFGLGLTYAHKDSLDLSLGFYENSHYKKSFYMGVKPHVDIFNDNRLQVSAGLFMGVVTGYDETEKVGIYLDGNTYLSAMPVFSFGYDKVFVNIGWLPGAVTTLQLQFKIH